VPKLFDQVHIVYIASRKQAAVYVTTRSNRVEYTLHFVGGVRQPSKIEAGVVQQGKELLLVGRRYVVPLKPVTKPAGRL
jgi:hypothetical protein